MKHGRVFFRENDLESFDLPKIRRHWLSVRKSSVKLSVLHIEDNVEIVEKGGWGQKSPGG